MEHPFEGQPEHFRFLQDLNLSIYSRFKTLALGMPDLINIGNIRGLQLSLACHVVLPLGRVFENQRNGTKRLANRMRPQETSFVISLFQLAAMKLLFI